MPEKELNVVLLKPTTKTSIRENLESAYRAMRQCYYPGYAADIDLSSKSNEEMERAVKDLIVSGHKTISEHISFTFAIEGISKSLSHQFVRHRIATFSQQSQRYCGLKADEELNYIIPPSIKRNPEAYSLYIELMEQCKAGYHKLMKIFDENPKRAEDARFVLPNAAETKIVATFNISSLMHFFNLRNCQRSQWEIRVMANEMLNLCKEVYPTIFESAGAGCEQLKLCPEIPKFSCGKYPSIYTVSGIDY